MAIKSLRKYCNIRLRRVDDEKGKWKFVIISNHMTNLRKICCENPYRESYSVNIDFIRTVIWLNEFLILHWPNVRRRLEWIGLEVNQQKNNTEWFLHEPKNVIVKQWTHIKCTNYHHWEYQIKFVHKNGIQCVRSRQLQNYAIPYIEHVNVQTSLKTNSK